MNINKYIEQVNKENTELLLWVQSNLRNYLEKKGNEENVGEIEHILDYLGSGEAPTRLKKMSYSQAKNNAEKWNKAQTKKGKDIDEVPGIDTKVIKRWKDGFTFVRLVSESSFKREGFMMSHCVASYYGKKDVRIYSLRDANNKPHCTMEIVLSENKEGVQQIKGKGNGHIHPHYITKILRVLTTFFKMPVKESEMENLGYSKFSKENLAFLKQHFNFKSLKFGEQYYVYNHGNFEPL